MSLDLEECSLQDSSRDVEECRLQESEWVVSIRKKLEQARKDAAVSSTDKLCIYKVPKALRERNEKVYTPQLVSLGPYHHGDERLCEMENKKWRILDHVIQREKQDIKLYLDAVTELEEDARSCYEGSIRHSENRFVEMMVLDGVFVLEFLEGYYRQEFKNLGYSSTDIIFSNAVTKRTIKEDMIKLENQLPLFILDTLQGLQAKSRSQKIDIVDKIHDFFHALRLIREVPIGFPLDRDRGGLHFLDVFLGNLLKTSESEEVNDCLDVFRKWKMMVFEKLCCCFATTIKRGEYVHCATELKDAGVTFRERKTNLFWDIKFENGILKIPPISIDDSTKLILLNLIAFEQCHPHCGNEITAYAVFMDQLIDSEQDVAHLRKQKIVDHSLGNDAEVAILFNDLCKDIIFSHSESYLSQILEEANQYSKHKCNAWSASLKQKYFSNPWSSISLLAAIVLLVLTLVQTIFAIKDYHKP